MRVRQGLTPHLKQKAENKTSTQYLISLPDIPGSMRTSSKTYFATRKFSIYYNRKESKSRTAEELMFYNSSIKPISAINALKFIDT